MALHDLLAAIEAEATAEVARLRDGRHREAGAIIADAERQARDLEAAAVAAAEREEREAGELRLTAARDLAAAGLRDAHEAAYQLIVAETRARLAAARDRDDYPAILAALLAEAQAALPTATVVRVDPADERLARGLLPGDSPVRVEATLRSAGGVEVADGAGTRVRNTVEERLAAAEPALRALAGRLLRPGGDGEARSAELREVPA
jgi:vacuolar-type H+-ATPase subunit E/Vma4